MRIGDFGFQPTIHSAFITYGSENIAQQIIVNAMTNNKIFVASSKLNDMLTQEHGTYPWEG